MSTKIKQKLVQNMNKQVNQLRRELEEANRLEGGSSWGSTLNRSQLVNGYVSAQMGIKHRELYTKQYIKPDISAEFSFAIDSSGSMQGESWRQCVYLVDALHDVCTSMGIKSSSASAKFDYPEGDISVGASTPYTPTAKWIKKPQQAWTPALLDRMKDMKPTGGTSLICYAETAMDMLADSEERYRVAFFLTDGYCNTLRYLESMRQYAEERGIILVGIGFGRGVYGQGLPNEICGADALEVSRHMMDTLVKVLRKSI